LSSFSKRLNKGFNMKKFLFVLCLLVIISPLFSAFEDYKTGTRPGALGGAFTALSDDHNAPFWNPSGLAYVEKGEIFCTYRRLFNLVNNFTFTSCVPLRWGNFGLSIRESSVKGDYTDDSGWIIESNRTLEAERALIFSHGFSLIKEVSFGYNLVGYHVQNVRFGDYYSVGLDIGMIMNVYKRWKIGFFYHNLNSPTIGDAYKHPLPEEISLGVSYSPFDNVITLLDFEKQLNYNINVKMGVEVEVVENLLTLRGGVASEPILFSLGFGTGFKHIILNYSFETHSELPITHLVEAGWKF
jgi:hypothetical protein